MQKDYAYVTRHGNDLYGRVPDERKPHLGRILSESYLVQGDVEGARKYYEKDLAGRVPKNRSDYFYAGSLLYALKDYKGAVENYSKMDHRTDSLGQIANYQLGYSQIQLKDKVSALDAFRDAAGVEYDKAIQEDAWMNWAKLSFDLNKDASVFNSYMRKYPSREKNDQIYSYMALSCLYNHDYSGAVDAYSHIDLLDDDQKANYMKANYLRAQQLIGGGSWKDAIPLLKAASFYSNKHDGFNQLARYWLGESQFRSEQYSAAAESFKDLFNISALDKQEEGKLLPYNIGWCYFKNKEYAAAAKWFDEYLGTRDPEMGEDAALRRADCDFVTKDYAKAIKEYENATQRFAYADNLYPYLQRGIAYGLSGKNDKKIESLSRALTSKPSAQYYPETMYELGRAYVAGGKADDAATCFEKLRKNSSDKTINARSLIELGMIARNKSDNDKALGYYKQVVDEMPGTEYAQDALLAIESIYQTQGRADEYLDYADKVGANFGKTDSEKDDMYFAAAEQVFMTENYENYNWFGRYETWTEPCAIIDSYMLAVQLWQHTLKFKYLELAEKIYYNAICHTQRYNGGFGCDNCPGITQNTDDLDVHIPEAHWCCTMRGGEGLSRAAEYTAFVDGKCIYVPFYRNADFTYNNIDKMFTVEERTDYPFAETVTFNIKQNSMGKLALCLPHYFWMESISVKVNNKLLTCPEQDGFIVLTCRFRSRDIISVSFKMKTGCGKTINPYNTSVDDRTAFYGPLQLCVRDSTKIILPPDARIEQRSNGKFYLRGTQIQFGTIYHLMTPEVWKPKQSAWQMLFKAH